MRVNIEFIVNESKNVKSTKKRKRTPSFKVELSGDENKKTSVLEKLENIKGELEFKLNKYIGNLQVIEYLFSLWTDISER